jgi:hypothetical protein
MHHRTMSGIFDGSAKDFVGERGGISLAKKDKPHDISHWIDVGPVKIDMGIAPGGLLKIDQQRSDRVGYYGTSGMQNAT